MISFYHNSPQYKYKLMCRMILFVLPDLKKIIEFKRQLNHLDRAKKNNWINYVFFYTFYKT